MKREGYSKTEVMDYRIEPQSFLSFNGKDSYVEIPCTRSLRNLTSRSHTISVLVRSHQQEEKVPIWLVGDMDRRFCEYPILRRPVMIMGYLIITQRYCTTLE